jgi:chromosome segregation ATPase
MAAGWQEWVIGAMGSAIAVLITRELKQKDGIWRRVEDNHEAMQQGLENARKEFSEALERITTRFSASIDALNSTVATLAGTVSELEATMAKEYATRADLREAKDEFRRDLDKCQESCARRGKD